MPRAEAGSAKAVGNAIKAKGLTKLRFYCQICQKACRDENGYKCHVESESHMRQIAALGDNSGKVIDNFSKEFQDGFVTLLSRRFGSAKINANKVYQEYIQERHHLHMNATRWVSLSEFVKHLGREGICKVEEITDEGQFGWYVTWIDNSPAALARQDALQKMQRARLDEEGRARKHLAQQIQNAKREKDGNATDAGPSTRGSQDGLQRKEGAPPLKIADIALKAKADDGGGEKKDKTAAPVAPFKIGAVFKSAPMSIGQKPSLNKAGNVFKSSAPVAKPATPSATHGSHAGPKIGSLTAAEQIMAEEQQALHEKRRSIGPQPSAKRMRM